MAKPRRDYHEVLGVACEVCLARGEVARPETLVVRDAAR
jgi:hypothetical protein